MKRTALVIGAFLALRLFALDPSRPLDLYSLDVWRDGLPQYTVRTIVQTRDGYLWFGTFEGLVRFDGLRFDVFDAQNTPAMTSARVVALREDREGSLWIGTERGDALRYRDNAFTPVPGTGPANALLAANDGGMWIGTTDGLVYFRDGRMTKHATPGAVHALVHGIGDVLWVGTTKGLLRFDGTRMRPVAVGGGGTASIESLAISRDGSLWVGTLYEGLFFVDRNGNAAPAPAGQLAQSPRYISDLLQDAYGTMWIAASPGGLIRVRGGTMDVLDTQQGLPNSSVRALFEDREGCLWVGTNGGLARLRDLKFVNYTMRNGLAEDNVRVVVESKDGGLWVGTYGGGIDRIRDGKVVAHYGAAEGHDVYIRTLAEDADGALWAGTSTGLSRIRESRVTTFPTKVKLDALEVLRDGTLLVSVGGSLHSFRDGRLEPYLDESGEVRVIREDRRGTLWLGTADHGLLEVRDRSIIRRWPIAGSAVFALHEDANGELWIGTHDGLAVVRGGAIRPTPIRSVVFQILDDGRGFFWLTSNRGITRVERKSLEDVMAGRATHVEKKTFNKTDGMGSDQCNGATQPAGVRMRDGQLAIPTVAGLTLVDPGDLHPNRVPPSIVLREVLVDGKPVEEDRPATLPWSSERYEFRYEGLSLRAPELVHFRHRIDGFDDDWVDAGSRRAAFYNSLPPGPHVFRVMAVNNDGVASTREAVFAFTLPAPPWRRGWAIALYILAAILVVELAIWLRGLATRRRTEMLETKVRERTAELAEAESRALDASRAKSLFLANMSHELRTPLNAVLGFAQLMARSSTLNARDRESLAVIRRGGEHLLGLINDVLSISKIEAGKLTLDPRPFDLRATLAGVVELMRVRAETTAVELLAESGASIPPGVLGDEQKLRQVLTNLLGNALKFTNAGTVSVRVDWAGGRASFEVRDTGSGIAPEEMAALFQPFVQTGSGQNLKEGSGLGLAITRELVELMGGTIEVSSEVGRGTTFRFAIDLPAAVLPPVRQEMRQVIGLAPGERARRIAVVDDTPENRILLCRLLESVGFDVRDATNGAEALDLWRSWKPELIFLDQRMPGMDGSAVTRAIRATDASTVIIAVTASVFEHEREKVLRHGANDFVLKPFTEEKIFAMIARYLGVRFRERGRRRVLLIDDDAINRHVAREILSQLGMEVTEAHGGVEALATLEVATFDAILVDLEMPDLDGRATIREIRARERFRDVPIIVMTAHDRDTATIPGMTDYLGKPLDERQLAAVLSRHL